MEKGIEIEHAHVGVAHQRELRCRCRSHAHHLVARLQRVSAAEGRSARGCGTRKVQLPVTPCEHHIALICCCIGGRHRRYVLTAEATAAGIAHIREQAAHLVGLTDPVEAGCLGFRGSGVVMPHDRRGDVIRLHIAAGRQCKVQARSAVHEEVSEGTRYRHALQPLGPTHADAVLVLRHVVLGDHVTDEAARHHTHAGRTGGVAGQPEFSVGRQRACRQSCGFYDCHDPPHIRIRNRQQLCQWVY